MLDSLRRLLIASFCTWHLTVVAIHIIPQPPRTDDVAFAIPEVRAELERFAGMGSRLGLLQSEGDAAVDELIDWVRWYADAMDEATWFTYAYLRPLGSTQTWNMFGGNPKQQPEMAVISVRLQGEDDDVVVWDGRWGGGAEGHRFRKIHRNLSVSKNKRFKKRYAAFWAQQWEAEHPDRPVESVRWYFARERTPTAADTRAGAERTEKKVKRFKWKAP